MPSVSVPLYGTPGWKKLQAQRKTFWAAADTHVLGEHFKASEFCCHDGSWPPIVARPGMVALVDVFLEPLRAKFGACLVLSGYRHQKYNAEIGGARHSQHIYEDGFESVAADLRFQKGSPALWAAEAKRLRRITNGSEGGVGRYDRSGFIHVDNRTYTADWAG